MYKDYSKLSKYLFNKENGEILPGHSSLKYVKENKFTMNESFTHYEFGNKKSNRKTKQSSFEFRPGRGFDNSTHVLWRASDYKSIKEDRNIRGAELGLEYRTLAVRNNKDPVVSNLKLIDYFESNIPQLNSKSYISHLDKARDEMKKYSIDRYLYKADYNDYSYQQY